MVQRAWDDIIEDMRAVRAAGVEWRGGGGHILRAEGGGGHMRQTQSRLRMTEARKQTMISGARQPCLQRGRHS